MGHCQAAGPDAPGRWFPFLRSNMSALLAPGTVTSFCKAKKVAVFFKLLDFIKENVQKSLVMAAEPPELKHSKRFQTVCCSVLPQNASTFC